MTWPTATQLLWQAAGSPTDLPDVEPFDGDCWWCGRPSTGLGRPCAVLPKTFPWPTEASAPSSRHLCLACGWTLCEAVPLPAEVELRQLARKVERGARVVLEDGRYLVLALADGTVGRWSTGLNTAAEEGWHEVVDELRAEPRDVGDLRFLGRLLGSEMKSAPVKWRSFHHFGSIGPDRWMPCTDSDRMEIRRWLLEPPASPWVGVIGDGKKHHGIRASLVDAVSDGRMGTQVVYHLGEVIRYEPETLTLLVGTIENLVLAGATDDEISSGQYKPRATLAKHDPEIRATLHGYIPVVQLEKEVADLMASTVRHNMARGAHQVELTAKLVATLTKHHWTDERIGQEIGMDPDEVLRMKQVTGLAEIFADREFSQAWTWEES